MSKSSDKWKQIDKLDENIPQGVFAGNENKESDSSFFISLASHEFPPDFQDKTIMATLTAYDTVILSSIVLTRSIEEIIGFKPTMKIFSLLEAANSIEQAIDILGLDEKISARSVNSLRRYAKQRGYRLVVNALLLNDREFLENFRGLGEKGISEIIKAVNDACLQIELAGTTQPN